MFFKGGIMSDRMYLLAGMISGQRDVFLYIPEGTSATGGQAAKIVLQDRSKLRTIRQSADIWGKLMEESVVIQLTKDPQAEASIKSGQAAKKYEIPRPLAWLIQKMSQLERTEKDKRAAIEDEISSLKPRVALALRTIIQINRGQAP